MFSSVWTLFFCFSRVGFGFSTCEHFHQSTIYPTRNLQLISSILVGCNGFLTLHSRFHRILFTTTKPAPPRMARPMPHTSHSSSSKTTHNNTTRHNTSTNTHKHTKLGNIKTNRNGPRKMYCTVLHVLPKIKWDGEDGEYVNGSCGGER